MCEHPALVLLKQIGDAHNPFLVDSKQVGDPSDNFVTFLT